MGLVIKTKRQTAGMVGLALGVAALLGGCGSGATREVNYHLLGAEVQWAAGGPAEAVGGSIVEVTRVETPDYLRRSGLVLERDDGTLRPARYHLWGESMEAGIKRTLNAALRQLAPGEREHRIAVEVHRFHGSESGEVRLSGEWRSVEDGDAGGAFRIRKRQTADGYAAMARAHEACLIELAEQIAAALLEGDGEDS